MWTDLDEFSGAMGYRKGTKILGFEHPCPWGVATVAPVDQFSAARVYMYAHVVRCIGTVLASEGRRKREQRPFPFTSRSGRRTEKAQ